MYKKTVIAGGLFTALYGAALVLSGLLFWTGLMILKTPEGLPDGWAQIFGMLGALVGGVVILLAVLIGIVALIFFLSSVGIIKKALSESKYKKKRLGTIVFLVGQGLVAVVAIVFGIASIAQDAAVVAESIILAAIPAVIIAGMVLIILDLVKDGKEAASIAPTPSDK
jgi:hypothetical protein